MKSNKKVYIAFTVLIVAMTLLFLGGFDSEKMVYNHTVKEVLDQGDAAIDKGFRVGGRVNPGSVIKDHKNVSVTFEIRDIQTAGYVMHIEYVGILPDTFKEDQDVLVEGKYLGNNTLRATNIMTKCASKYESEYE